MKMQLKILLTCLSGLLFFQCSLSDEPAQVSGSTLWRCTCDASTVGPLNNTLASDCSSSCNCIPDDGGWNCSCATNETAKATGRIGDSTCFSSCNCTSDYEGAFPTKKQSRKGVVAVLLLCVMLTTIAFLASIALYFYRKDKFSGKSSALSSDKETSWSSGSNLIRHRSTSLQEYHINVKYHFNPFSALLQKIYLACGREKGTLKGAIVQFSYVELEQATDVFSNANLIGMGGSSNVYRGQLHSGKAVAIKKYKPLSGSQADYDYMTEIELISRLNHCHVVTLLGYCCESHGKKFERLLVFEYMSNGNLRDALDASKGKERMDWSTRVKIALGTARGLEYLHESASPKILHRDIKSTNILLDDKFSAKITDLGMAKILMNDDLTSCSSSPARMLGTFGYFAPEYAIVGKASLKSDVFSFGVVLLELITGRPPIHRSSNKVDESLVIWATTRMRDSRLAITELPDPVLKGNFPEEEMQIMVHLARECLHWDPDARLSMSEVVQVLSMIASDKTKRRNFPSDLIMGSSSRNIKSTQEAERRNSSCENSNIMHSSLHRVHTRSSLPVTVERNLCESSQNKMEMILSAEYMESLILLTSRVRSWRSSDDEIVDLTEPRFEAFVQPNCQSL